MLEDMLNTIYSHSRLLGCADVVTRPGEGYRAAGWTGLASGIGTGVLGLFAKPIAGFADVIARGMHAVSHMATVDRSPEHCA